MEKAVDKDVKSGGGAEGRKGLVLVVDDDDEEARRLRCVVERHGFETTRATNGAAALAALQTDRPDVILLDLVMPVMDGLELLSILRQMPALRDTPVIVLSLPNDDALVSAARHEGATLCLPKPCSARDLAAALVSVLTPGAGASPLAASEPSMRRA